MIKTGLFIICLTAVASVQGFAPVSQRRAANGIASLCFSDASPAIVPQHRSFLSESRLPAVFVDVDERAGRDIGAMEDWAADCGIQRAPGFQLTSEDGVEWSVMASEDIPEDTTLLAVPASLIFSSTRARDQLYAADAEEFLIRLDKSTADELPQFYLFLNILTEYERGDESPWYPWLNSLPRLYNNGSAMTRTSTTETRYMLPFICFKLSLDRRFVYCLSLLLRMPPSIDCFTRNG